MLVKSFEASMKEHISVCHSDSVFRLSWQTIQASILLAGLRVHELWWWPLLMPLGLECFRKSYPSESNMVKIWKDLARLLTKSVSNVWIQFSIHFRLFILSKFSGIPHILILTKNPMLSNQAQGEGKEGSLSFYHNLMFFIFSVGWTSESVRGFGEQPGVKAQMLNIIHSTRTVMRSKIALSVARWDNKK